MDFEFQESDIIFSGHHQGHLTPDRSASSDDLDSRSYYGFYEMMSPDHNGVTIQRGRSNNQNRKRGTMKNSPPVVIPGNSMILRYPDFNDHSDEEGEEDGDIVPPHEIVGRRVAGKMTSSVCARNGRLLKGRHLSEVRNSILRMTGFLES